MKSRRLSVDASAAVRRLCLCVADEQASAVGSCRSLDPMRVPVVLAAPGGLAVLAAAGLSTVAPGLTPGPALVPAQSGVQAAAQAAAQAVVAGGGPLRDAEPWSAPIPLWQQL